MQHLFIWRPTEVAGPWFVTVDVRLQQDDEEWEQER